MDVLRLDMDGFVGAQASRVNRQHQGLVLEIAARIDQGGHLINAQNNRDLSPLLRPRESPSRAVSSQAFCGEKSNSRHIDIDRGRGVPLFLQQIKLVRQNFIERKP